MANVREVQRLPPAWWLPASFTLLLLAFSLLPQFRASAELTWSLWGACAVLALLQGRLLSNSGQDGRELKLKVSLIPSHYVQAFVQTCIYVYWGLYWEQMRHQAALILAQIIFAYAFDMLVGWSRRKTWHLGFGQFPIILSTNFFLCFKEEWFYLQFTMIAVGILGKEFFCWNRDGRKRHIFNPSGFALSVFSLGLILSGTTDLTWGAEIATTLANAPHMYVAIFMAGLVVQFFFSVTIVTLFAAAALVAANLVYSSVTGVHFFVDASIPIAVFLGLHLLVTDPSTSPRSRLGSAVFGALYGLSVFGLFEFLRQVDVPLFYDKLLFVPVLNLCVPLLDRLGKSRRVESFRLSALLRATRPRRVNYAFMVAWIGLFGWMLASNFVGRAHEGDDFKYWRQACDEGKRFACENLVTKLELTCNNGGGEECNMLGVLYNRGEIMPLDPLEGVSYFDQACRGGFHKGCQNVVIQAVFDGNVSMTSAGVSDAIEQLPAGCEDGESMSCFLLGYAHVHGHGVPRDIPLAQDLLSSACDMGEAAACAELERGLGTLFFPPGSGPDRP